MNIPTGQFIGNKISKGNGTTFQAINPVTNTPLDGHFAEATAQEIDEAVQLAELAFPVYRGLPNELRATFLEQIGEEIMALGDTLIDRCQAETALPVGRLQGERGRTVNQLKLFAQVVREGSWVDARIDTAQPDRQPAPKPDIRQLSVPLGPVGIFGASNFPLAFSVAGGDTASALAAGCPVVVKGHPAHPGTSALVAQAILTAARKTEMPEGVFSLVQGTSHEVGGAIVQHPLITAIGFTGSFGGGKALFDLANLRPVPIPVFAEMGSTNPMFLLPGALRERAAKIAVGFAGSVTLGVGQFCTNPGLAFLPEAEEAVIFTKVLKEKIGEITAGTMLTAGIQSAFERGTKELSTSTQTLAQGPIGDTETAAAAQIFTASAKPYSEHPELAEEVFGPSSVLITGNTKADLLEAAKNLSGHLTATVHGTPEDLETYAALFDILQRKVGRILINGFPTGVEVCHSMVHGGPFPATTAPQTTSVGTLAIKRFARPVCYQNFPPSLLPAELKDDNPLGIWRMVDGEFQR